MNSESTSGPQVYLDSLFTGSEMPGPKTSLDDLEKLRRRAKELRDEVPFFQALLDAAVYVHAPLSDDSGRVRFIQFAHPDTQALLLPFFSDAQQAHKASEGACRVLAMTGRDLFELTLGATLMLNPNEDRVTLYPEEVEELLEFGTVAPIDEERLQEETMMGFRLPIHAPDWLEARLQDMFAQLPYVETAYLGEMVRPYDGENFVLVIAVGVAPMNDEHAGRAISTKIYTYCHGLQIPVDILTFDPMVGAAGMGAVSRHSTDLSASWQLRSVVSGHSAFDRYIHENRIDTKGHHDEKIRSSRTNLSQGMAAALQASPYK